MVNVTLKNMEETNKVLKDLNIERRWTSFVTEDKYNELAKQALNCIVTFILASYAENAGMAVKWERFPKIAIYRAFQKSKVYAEIPESIIVEVCKIGGIKPEQFNETSREVIAELTDEDFANSLSEVVGTDEMRIYKAARKIASYVELIENQNKIRDQEDYIPRVQDIYSALDELDDIPGVKEVSNVNGPVFKLLLQISRLRNQNRWATMTYNIECSVLGHLLDTAIFAYFMALEEYPKNEKLATKLFFIGIFHDVAETWTTDFPSTLKDRVPGLRRATELFELKVIQENIYNVVPDFVEKKIKLVMMEDPSNEQFKKLMKGADYLAADSECWRQYIAGSRDPYFLRAMNRTEEKINSGQMYMPPIARELHDSLKAYAEALNL